MLASSKTPPAVSILIPTYNRASLLPQAFEAIQAQTWPDWELVVVDDGSTDDTRQVVERFRAASGRPVRYVYQENQGPYAARNTGLEWALGRYLAFFDSDDLWLPHHLRDGVEALEASPEVDWVFAACRIVELATGEELAPSHFYDHGRPRAFLKLSARPVGELRVLDDPRTVACMIENGSPAGLQHSVIRRRVFERLRFPPFRVGEDQVLAILALKAGYRFAYFDRVSVIYHVHEENTSASSMKASLEKRLRGVQTLAQAYASLAREASLTPEERLLLRRRLSRDWFWNIGYSLLWQHGRRREALKVLWKGLRLWPTNWRYWKVYLVSRLKWAAGL
jgi:glycosyltransferase involved in cell wall biosynthesis